MSFSVTIIYIAPLVSKFILGHGSGKLLAEEKPGAFNFDSKNPPLSPVTGKPITCWYKPGETWGSIFKEIAASYEECRAEAVAMFLCVQTEILKIFGHEGQEADDIVYIAYLNMARAGLMGLEFYGKAFSLVFLRLLTAD